MIAAYMIAGAFILPLISLTFVLLFSIVGR
jgi:hypothetical protein